MIKKDQKTHAEAILSAALELVRIEGRQTFTRRDIRIKLGVSQQDWMSGYTAIFQAMRIDQPGGAPYIASQYRNVFKRINRGIFSLTEYGHKLLNQCK